MGCSRRDLLDLEIPISLLALQLPSIFDQPLRCPLPPIGPKGVSVGTESAKNGGAPLSSLPGYCLLSIIAGSGRGAANEDATSVAATRKMRILAAISQERAREQSFLGIAMPKYCRAEIQVYDRECGRLYIESQPSSAICYPRCRRVKTVVTRRRVDHGPKTGATILRVSVITT